MARNTKAVAILEPPPPLPAPQPRMPSPSIARTYDDTFGAAELSKQAVRDRAYQIYLARNGAPGDPVSDWLAAEQELRDELRRATRSGNGR